MTGYLFRPPWSTPESRAGRPPRPRTEKLPGMLIERDVAVAVAPGEPLYIDVYRPDTQIPAAPLIAWSPYGKHNPAPIGILYPRSGVRPEHTSEITTFEAPDPVYWVPHGYAIITADIPGTWYSQGRATYCSPEEARAFAQLIEWAGTQPWSNGRVGLSGVSYLTTSQWRVAELSPPHLAAINPWEGWTDTYREVVRHGELVRPRPALPRHAGGIPADLLGAQVARRARPQKMGLLLRPGLGGAPAGLLRLLPA